MVDFFIRRPIFATVCALLIVLAGAVCIPSLPISLYPQLAPPQVVVTSNYIGANSKDVESAVTIILEQAINGVEGMRYMSSTSSNDGTSSITVTFQTGYSLDIAAVDVQNRVASAQGRLPAVVNNTGITITKANSNFVFAAGFISPDHSLSQAFISNYLDVYVSDALKRVPGVGAVIIFGERKYAMRIWLDPNRLAARGLTALDVTNALAEQNIEVPAGQLGQQPSDPSQQFQMAVRVVGRLSDPREFENIILKNSADASGIVLLKDVGRAEIGAENYSTDLKFSGGDAVGIGVQQLSNANALDVDKKCRAVLAELQKSFPPGMQGIIAVDTTIVIGDSIREVVQTIGEAVVIVIIVIFLFLQDWRATIIPAVTIPVSLIGTFAFIKIFGFSINSLTLFGITLATGLVVDDAIVVIENVQRHIEKERCDAHRATSEAMAEVTSAVIATSLVLISVFIPVSFFPGTTGILYKQFSLTNDFSIAISAFNALTLSPALAAILLRAEQKKTGIMGFFLNPIERFIQWLIRTYAKVVTFVVRIRFAMLALFFAGLAATVYMYNHVPTAFIPQEDQSYFLIIVQTPPGASLSYTSDFADKVADVVRKNDGVFGTFSVMGFSLAGGSSPNAGLIFAPLKPIDERTKMGPQYSAHNIVGDVGPKLFGVPGGIAFAAEPPAIAGIGTVGGFQFILQDGGRNTFGDIDRIAHTIVGQSRAPGSGLTGMNTTFTANDPQVLVTIDREKAKAIGVPFSQITAAMGTFMGSTYVNDFDFNNRSYRAYVQADQQFRTTSKDLRQYYVRSDSGQMIPLDNLASLTETSGPQVINHYNLFRSAEIDGSPGPGLSSGQGLERMQQLFEKNKLQGMMYTWTGLALEEVESAGKAIIIFGLGLLVVYLTLSAQYESFALPFIILLAVPMAVLGALLLVSARGLVDDVYVQIGLVMLIGLSAKNSILIVEFAEQLLEQGRTIIEAAIEAAELRLRPILMTSIAFILGVGPLYVAKGAGAPRPPLRRHRDRRRNGTLHSPQPHLHSRPLRHPQNNPRALLQQAKATPSRLPRPRRRTRGRVRRPTPANALASTSQVVTPRCLNLSAADRAKVGAVPSVYVTTTKNRLSFPNAEANHPPAPKLAPRRQRPRHRLPPHPPPLRLLRNRSPTSTMRSHRHSPARPPPLRHHGPRFQPASPSPARPPILNPLMALGPRAWGLLRETLTRLLHATTDPARRQAAEAGLHSIAGARLHNPVHTPNYTDFYASIHHATRVGKLFRPDNPLLPNYKHIPIGYHGRASSLITSGTPILRPYGPTRPNPTQPPPSARPNPSTTNWNWRFTSASPTPSASPSQSPKPPIISSASASSTTGPPATFSPGSTNRSAPSLAKNFATSTSPWITPMAAFEPFQTPLPVRPKADPKPLPILKSQLKIRPPNS